MPFFETKIPISIYDINYGGHLGHDRLLSLMHEARIRFLASLGQSEQSFYHDGLILKNLTVDYLNESFYQDELTFKIMVKSVESASFKLEYDIVNQDQVSIAKALLTMVVFNYESRKVKRVPKIFRDKFLTLNAK